VVVVAGLEALLLVGVKSDCCQQSVWSALSQLY